MGYGSITSHALMSLEARGTLFVNPGMEVCSNMAIMLSALDRGSTYHVIV